MPAVPLDIPDPVVVVAPCVGDTLPVRQGTIDTTALDEISGVVVGPDGALWVIEDSGNPPFLSSVTAAGTLQRRVRLAPARNVDWEELAIGPCPSGSCLFVGDIGDNAALRPEVAVLRVALPIPEARRVRPEPMRFRYPGGPQDAEAMVVTPDGRVLVFTKRSDGSTRVFGLPDGFGGGSVVEAVPLGELPVGIDGVEGRSTRITGAALTDGGWLLLRSYAAVLAFPPQGAGWDGSQRRMLPVQPEPQGEAIAWDTALRGYWTISEFGDAGAPVPLWFRGCPADSAPDDR